MASNSVQNQSKRRPPLDSIDKNVANKRSRVTRSSVEKMAHTTRTFWIQAEALSYIAERQNKRNLYDGEILYLFSFESQPDGRRRYQVADIDIFINEYYQLPVHQRHTYEIIVDKKPCKLYFDLEYDTATNPTVDGPQLTVNFIQYVLNFMRNRSDDLNYSMEDVLILDSTSRTKFSRHVIFQTRDPFLDNLAVGKFVSLILEDLHGCLLNHQCPAILDGSPLPEPPPLSYAESIVFARNLLASLESRLARFENCQCRDDYSQLRFKDLVQFIVKKNSGNGLAWFCDMGVYTKNRAFRLLRSSKFDKKECFTVAPENRWEPAVQSPQPSTSGLTEAERLTFKASLVYFNRPIGRFIHLSDDMIPDPQRPIPAANSNNGLKEILLHYPELCQFMSSITEEKPVNGVGQYRFSRLWNGKEVQNEYQWYVRFMYTGNYKYCERIQRHHKHNNIFFVADMRRGTYRQKCYDPDCKNFEGVEQVLPNSATPWLTIINEEWDETEKNLSWVLNCTVPIYPFRTRFRHEMRLSVILRNLKNVTEERIPKRKPYWLTKSNMELPGKSRALVDSIQIRKARVAEPGFFKRNMIARNNQRRNEFIEKDFFEQGPDVYGASRTIEYDGRFRMYGREKWITKLEKPKGTLTLNLNFQLEAVDLSQSVINTDGLDHYVGCANLKAMYLARCRYVDDWFLSRLAHEFHDQLLFLDLSDCRSIGTTGILALARLKSLKKLRLHNLPPFDGKEAAVMIFEEHVPGCLVEGIDYETEMIAGLLEAGETQPEAADELGMVGSHNVLQEATENQPRQSLQTN